MKPFLLPLLCLLLLARPAAAQLRGVVTDPAGAPVVGAQVEVWGPEARLAATQTDAEGTFTFPAQATATAKRLVLRRIGYRSLVVPVPAPSAAPARYVLHPEAVELPELVATLNRKPCPNREDPAARRLWTRARSRYSDDTRDREANGDWLYVEEDVTPDRVGVVDERRARLGSELGGRPEYPTSFGFRPTQLRIRELGYAFPMPWKDPSYRPWREFYAWEYPRLGTFAAHHFASGLFGERHTFSFQRRAPRETVLAFCGSRRGGQPYLEGTLTVGSDTTFVAAAWSFVTPEPRERAGGEVTFAPPVTAGGAPGQLRAARGVFWRRLLGHELFFQEAIEFIQPSAPAPVER